MELLQTPRQRHYVLGHEAFRIFAEHNTEQFLSIMSSEGQRDFIKELIERVEENCPQDPTELSIDEVEVELTSVNNSPLVLIKMPEVKAYVECIYVGIVVLLDMNNPEATPEPEIGYFTLEYGEGDDSPVNFFCQWDDETHFVLAEMEAGISVSEFSLLIHQRIEKAQQ